MQSNAQQNTQLIQAMLQMAQANSHAHVQSMAAMYERAQARDTELFRVMAQRDSGGGDSTDALIKGLELGREMGGGAGSDDDDDMLGKVAEIAQSVVAGVKSAKDGTAPPNEATS
jgi:hypothetical protein